MLLAFEIAETAENDAMRRAAMTFVVVGAGPTGVGNGGRHRGNCACDLGERLPPH
jgi:NADH dehydrogenase FAD-containing subunit